MAAISPKDDSKRRRFPCSRRSTTLPSKGIRTLAKAGISHPLDPLSAPEIAVAVATVRAAGASPEVRDGMRLIEVALVEPEKNIVALADAYFFPPFQSSLVLRIKARGGHHRGKVISSRVIPEVQPAMVRNTRTVNRTGQLTGYKLVRGSNCLPLAGSDAKFLRKVSFLKHNLWVTAYASDEMYPGGEFPNQNPRIGEGLSSWVQKNRDLSESDVVLWYVFGVTHITRLEDWPVMRVDHIGFMLMPHGFFNCSPAVDVPPNSCESNVKDEGITKLVAKL